MMVLLSVLLGYVFGSISSAALVAKAKGVDIFSVGSGNAGFTNVWRTMGIKLGIIVLLGDILKGFLAAWIGFSLAGDIGMLLAAVGAVIGHTYSFLLRFRGGKGIAVAAGVLLYISPLTFLLCFITLTSLAYITGYMSVGSIAAALFCPVFLIVDKEPAMVVITFTLCAIFVIWMHRKNIQRLIKGTENKLDFRK